MASSTFSTSVQNFRRLAVWNARMVYIQRPGARVVVSEDEWNSIDQTVSPDAVPIIVLWPFSPIRFLYELEDTLPVIDRNALADPFATKGELKKGTLKRLEANLKKQKRFKIRLEYRRQGFSYAGSASRQGVLSVAHPTTKPLSVSDEIGVFAKSNSRIDVQRDERSILLFRVTVNDRMDLNEQFVTVAHELGHIFCGHLGECSSSGDDQESGWPTDTCWAHTSRKSRLRRSPIWPQPGRESSPAQPSI